MAEVACVLHKPCPSSKTEVLEGMSTAQKRVHKATKTRPNYFALLNATPPGLGRCKSYLAKQSFFS